MRIKMVGRGGVIAALLVYLGISVGCVLFAPPESRIDIQQKSIRVQHVGARPTRVAGLPFRGVAMQLQRVDFMDNEYQKSIDEIVAVGADTVLFVVDSKMENGSSSRIYLDMRFTPTPQQLGGLIDYAKGKNLRVILMPIVLLDNPRGMEWRGTIKPEDWNDWWQSYRGILYHYSWIAELHKVDVLVVGSELVSTETRLEEWRQTIEEVRKTFKGMITYSANWDHYKDIPFWSDLDLISMNSYYKLGENHRVGVEEIQRRWGDIKVNLANFQKEVGKPLIFLEVGWCSQANAAHEPWDYTQPDEPIDLELQRKLYEGFFRSFHGTPWFGGFMIWEWPPGNGGPEDRNYTPEAKPAEKVLREWLAKPRWQVQ
jgi:hypothetical protein